MPYIKQDRRYEFEGIWYFIPKNLTAGELNYIISMILKRISEDANYARYNELVGALECCKQEFIRRNLNPYEDKKIQENGDI